jgi:hypothetical protein
MDLKVAAENLLKIADQIEKEAEQKTIFACESCNHTVTLAEINSIRKSFAEKEAADSGQPVHVSKITVNDKVACGDCGEGCMCYEADEQSSKYWVEAAEEDDLETLDIAEEDDTEPPAKEEEESDKDTEETEDKEDTGEEDTGDDDEEELPEDLFEPVDEQDDKKKEEEEEVSDTEETDEEPAGEGEEETDTEETDVEEVEEEPKPEPKPKKKNKKDSPTDGKANVNKEPPPKFEKMPKEASDRFWSSVSRYSL